MASKEKTRQFIDEARIAIAQSLVFGLTKSQRVKALEAIKDFVEGELEAALADVR